MCACPHRPIHAQSRILVHNLYIPKVSTVPEEVDACARPMPSRHEQDSFLNIPQLEVGTKFSYRGRCVLNVLAGNLIGAKN